MTVRLRPHHLLCLLTYAGRGYSPAFVANYDAVAARLSAGEDILIVSGPDDICAPLLASGDAHCGRKSVMERDKLAAREVARWLAVPITAGATLRLDAARLATMRQGFAAGRIRAACAGCEWAGLCTTVAASGYRDARVR